MALLATMVLFMVSTAPVSMPPPSLLLSSKLAELPVRVQFVTVIAPGP